MNFMEKSSCDVFLNLMPSISEHGDLRSTYIVNFAFNTFLSYTAITLNILTIHAIRKTLALPKPVKTVLFSLAVSDLGVGLIVQPFYSTLLVFWLQRRKPGCISYQFFFAAVSLFAISSFFGVVAVSVERFLAINLHLRYQQVVTHKRVAAVVIALWILSGFLTLLTVWFPHDSSVIVIAVGTVCLFITTAIYIRIYLVFRRHRIQIQQALQVQRSASRDMANFANLRKSAVGVFYVYVVFMVCYLPRAVNLFIIVITSNPSTVMKGFSFFAWTLMLLNSSVNPVIYCLKMRHIRHAIMDILRNMSRPMHYQSQARHPQGHIYSSHFTRAECISGL